jgi:hypothetical protein
MSMSRTDDPDLLAMLAAFLGTTPEALAAGNAEAVRARLGEVRAAVATLIEASARAGAADSGDSEDSVAADRLREAAAELRRALGRAGLNVADITRGDDAPRAQGGEPDPHALAQAFGTLTDWLEQRRPGIGREVDALIAELDRVFGALPGARAARAAREERVRGDVRDSIAENLRRVGIKPSGDS